MTKKQLICDAPLNFALFATENRDFHQNALETHVQIYPESSLFCFVFVHTGYGHFFFFTDLWIVHISLEKKEEKKRDGISKVDWYIRNTVSNLTSKGILSYHTRHCGWCIHILCRHIKPFLIHQTVPYTQRHQQYSPVSVCPDSGHDQYPVLMLNIINTSYTTVLQCANKYVYCCEPWSDESFMSWHSSDDWWQDGRRWSMIERFTIDYWCLQQAVIGWSGWITRCSDDWWLVFTTIAQNRNIVELTDMLPVIITQPILFLVPELRTPTAHRQHGISISYDDSCIIVGLKFWWPVAGRSVEWNAAQLNGWCLNAACKVEIQPPIGRIHSWRFSIFNKILNSRQRPFCPAQYLYSYTSTSNRNIHNRNIQRRTNEGSIKSRLLSTIKQKLKLERRKRDRE